MRIGTVSHVSRFNDFPGFPVGDFNYYTVILFKTYEVTGSIDYGKNTHKLAITQTDPRVSKFGKVKM